MGAIDCLWVKFPDSLTIAGPQKHELIKAPNKTEPINLYDTTTLSHLYIYRNKPALNI
jgi:hypothetical protein